MTGHFNKGNSNIGELLKHALLTSSLCLVLTSACTSEKVDGPAGNLVPFREGIARIIGGGSTNNAEFKNPASINIYEAANVLGMGMARGNLNHHEYWQDGKPVTSKFDRFIGWYRHGVQPMLLFNHYPDSANPVGGYEKWYAIGEAFAERFRPNSDFLLSHGIKDWGVTDFMAFNEPEWHIIRHPGTMTPEEYRMALKGLADGVHAIDPGLRVSPAGYTFPLWENVLKDPPDPEALPLLQAVVPLYNDGTLHTLYLHPYVRRNDFKKSRSAQQIFGNAKKVLGITRDVRFGVLEYCYAGSYVVGNSKDDTVGIEKNANTAEFYGEATEQEKAIGQMAAFWDNLTVTGNDGRPVTDCVLAWEPLSTYHNNLNWGLAKTKAPYEGRLAANIIQLNTFLTNGMSFKSIDREREVFTLEGNGNKLVVWQNWAGWSSIVSDTFSIEAIPSGAVRLEVFDALAWTSGPGSSGVPRPAQQIMLDGERSITVKGLEKERTYLFMFWVNEVKHIPPQVSIRTEIKSPQEVNIKGQVGASEGKIMVSRIYNGAHLLAEIPSGGEINYAWKDPPPGLNTVRITAMDQRGRLNTAQADVVVPHKPGSQIIASEDTYIRGVHKRYSTKNFNALKVLEAKTGGPRAIRYPYIMFDLAKAPEVFRTCQLRIKVADNSDYLTNKCHLFVITNDNWKEKTLSWDTAPEKSDNLSTRPVPPPGEWIKFDVTEFIQEQLKGDGHASFRLEKPNRTYVSFYSKESHRLNAPILSFE